MNANVKSMPTNTEVYSILQDPLAGGREWSLQGLGMLRTYLDDEQRLRLHIWDLETQQAWNDEGQPPSTIHDHPWDFESLIYSGTMTNQRFQESTCGDLYKSARIRCGEGGGLVEEPTTVGLYRPPPELLLPGESYDMEAPELHESYPTAGCVSVIRREFHGDRDHARVCWRKGDWVSAEPRPATFQEISHFTTLALRNWYA